ncbi:unnamed protein product [Peniophora sp. CBMAI 1063]|nr:unnamed protein product [Peniophora sp. CBMAI 1063]
MIDSEDLIIDLAEMYGFEFAIPLTLPNACLTTLAGARARFYLDLAGEEAESGGRECKVGNLVSYIPDAVHDIAQEGMWFGIVTELNTPGNSFLTIRRLMSARFLHALSRSTTNGPVNQPDLRRCLNDTGMDRDSKEQLLSSRQERLSMLRICAVLTRSEFRSIGFNNGLRVLTSLYGHVVSIVEAYY